MPNDIQPWTIIAASIAIIGLVLSTFTSLVAFTIEQRRKSSVSQFKLGRPTTPVSMGDVAGVEFVEQELSINDSFENLLNQRLDECREMLQQYQKQANLNGIANVSLIFGQTVIGGILATSFIQEILSQQFVGVLGVLVLLATLLHQSYRPDIQARVARAKARYLRWLIRKSENQKVRHGRGIYADIVEEITEGLDKVEIDEDWVTQNSSKDTNGDNSLGKHNNITPSPLQYPLDK